LQNNYRLIASSLADKRRRFYIKFIQTMQCCLSDCITQDRHMKLLGPSGCLCLLQLPCHAFFSFLYPLSLRQAAPL